eukprot:3754872-Rhodomonas_salina.3
MECVGQRHASKETEFRTTGHGPLALKIKAGYDEFTWHPPPRRPPPRPPPRPPHPRRRRRCRGTAGGRAP